MIKHVIKVGGDYSIFMKNIERVSNELHLTIYLDVEPTREENKRRIRKISENKYRLYFARSESAGNFRRSIANFEYRFSALKTEDGIVISGTIQLKWINCVFILIWIAVTWYLIKRSLLDGNNNAIGIVIMYIATGFIYFNEFYRFRNHIEDFFREAATQEFNTGIND